MSSDKKQGSQESNKNEKLSDQQQKAMFKERLDKVRKNHPDCIPVFFLKHPEAPKYLKPPKTPFILFKKQLKIEQAMMSLYQQIEQKGLYFFCPYLNIKEQIKYSLLKPGPTIGEIHKKFSKNDYLTIVYSDKNLGMQGILRMQKWTIRLLVTIVIAWICLYGYSYYLSLTKTTNQEEEL